MRNTPLKAFAKANSQNLSDKALRDKRQRDKAAAMTSKRKDRKAENQRIGQSPNYAFAPVNAVTVTLSKFSVIGVLPARPVST